MPMIDHRWVERPLWVWKASGSNPGQVKSKTEKNRT